MNTCNDVNAVQVLNEYGKTDGHDLIRQGTFPRGSIQQEGAPGEAPWRCTGGELVGFDYMEGSNAGGRYIYVRLKKNQRLWQDIQLPAKAESRTDYQLGVEYNAGNFNECTVSVYRLEDGEVQGQAFFTYPLKGAGVQPDENADPAWMTLALIPIKVPTDATDIRVVFETPNPDITAFLFLKQTRSLLSLPPLGEHTKLQLTVDPDNEQLIHPEGALALCHGAKHLLEVKAPDGDAWLNLPISLLWLQDDDLPGEYRLTSTPPLNTNNGSQEEFYQDLLPSETAVWLLDAQGGSDTPSGEVTLGLGSFHHADKFALPAELGDFRFEVKKPQWDGETPIVELGNSTDLTAAVVSAFDDTRVLESKKVEWWLNGSHYKDEVTDASGKTTLHYTPKQGEGGTGNSVTFTVKCVDAYEKPSEQSLAVKVYDTTPWLVDLEVLLDDTPIDDLKELSLRLTRSNNRKLTLKPKPGSYFLDKNISLGWRETGQQLGITFTPDVPQKMLPEGISWSIKGGDESGLFTLEAKAFGLPVALALQGVQMSANLADEATLKYTSIGDEPKIPIFLRQTPGTVSIVPNADSPLGVLGLEGTLSFLKTGALTAQQLPATPAYGTGAVITDKGHTWSLEGKGVSGTFGLEVSVPGFTSLKLDKAALMSANVADEATLKYTSIGDEPKIPIFLRQTPGTVSIVPNADSPLGVLGLEGTLSFLKTGALTAQQLPATPAYGTGAVITDKGHTWSLEGKGVSGTFGLEVSVPGFTSLKLDNAALMSANLVDEATLKFTSRGDEPKIPIFLRQTPGTVSIVPNADSPFGVLGLEGTLSFLKTGALIAQQLPATPAYGTGAAITDNGHTWSLEGKGVSGTFGLEVSVPGFTSLKLDKAALMSNVVSEEVNVTVDGFSAGVPMVMIQGKSYALRAKPKQVSPLGDTQVLAWLNHDGGTVPKDELTAAPAYLAKRNITADGLTWKLTAGNVSGTFKLQAHIDSFNDMLKLENNLIT